MKKNYNFFLDKWKKKKKREREGNGRGLPNRAEIIREGDCYITLMSPTWSDKWLCSLIFILSGGSHK